MSHTWTERPILPSKSLPKSSPKQICPGAHAPARVAVGAPADRFPFLLSILYRSLRSGDGPLAEDLGRFTLYCKLTAVMIPSRAVSDPQTTASTRLNREFSATHWSVVLAAGADDTEVARQAFGKLFQIYWFPLYSFVRRGGYSEHDAQDLTQEFFLRAFQKGMAARADPARGRFRSFLLANLKNFLANQWDRARAQKRGGGNEVLALDYSGAEESYRSEPATTLTPEAVFDRRCAMAILDRGLNVWKKNKRQPAADRNLNILNHFLPIRRARKATIPSRRNCKCHQGPLQWRCIGCARAFGSWCALKWPRQWPIQPTSPRSFAIFPRPCNDGAASPK